MEGKAERNRDEQKISVDHLNTVKTRQKQYTLYKLFISNDFLCIVGCCGFFIYSYEFLYVIMMHGTEI